jgi:hypothetical protein
MSHVIIACIIVLSIFIIILFLITMHNNRLKARTNSILSCFNQAGIVHNLSITGQEILPDKVLGLDGPKGKLLLTEEKDGEYSTRVVDLREIAACTVKKVYAAIKSHEYRKNRPEDHLMSIALELEFIAGHAPMTVLFYKNTVNSIYELPQLETRAKNWATLLSTLKVSS